jgi:hypothetical protein
MSLVLFWLPYGFLYSAGELPRDVFGKDATANLGLSFINLSSASSPSWLIAVKFSGR